MTGQLECRRTYEPPVAVVRVAGTLDLATAPRLRTEVLKALADEPDAVLIEAAELAVDDDTHLVVFIALALAAAGWPSIPLMLCAPGAGVVEAIHRLGIDRHVMVCESVEAARGRVAARALPARLSSGYPAVMASVVQARGMVATACDGWRLTPLAPIAELVVSELAGNAVRHAGTPFRLSLTRTSRNLHIAVRDHADAMARLVGPAAEAEPGGRGLLIVEALSTGWGCIPVHDGKVTWATLRLSAP
jgi:anti-anti-sigma regulatory factor